MEAYEESGEYLEGEVGPVLTKQPYRTRLEKQNYNSEHDVLTDEDMQNFTEVVLKVLQRGGNGLMFCSRYQLRRCYQLFLKVKEDKEEHNFEDQDITRTF